jgi:hypothetical protein
MNELARQEGGASIRRVGGRVFRLDGTRWMDIGLVDSLPLIEVVAYSDAYFALVRVLPELSRYLAAGEDLTLAGKRTNLRIASTGIRSWNPGQLDRLLHAYRGQ